MSKIMYIYINYCCHYNIIYIAYICFAKLTSLPDARVKKNKSLSCENFINQLRNGTF